MDSAEFQSWEHTHTIHILFATISAEFDIPFLKAIPNKHIYNKRFSEILLNPHLFSYLHFAQRKKTQTI